MEYKGKALYESLVLCEFLEDAYPTYEPKLLPSDPFDRAYARLWIDFITKSVLPANMRLTQAQEPEKQKAALEETNKALRTFAEKVKGPYFLGDNFSLVDVAIAPWVARDYIVREHRGYTREGVSDAWKKYADNLEKRPSLINTTSVRVPPHLRGSIRSSEPEYRNEYIMPTFTEGIFVMRLRVKQPKPSEPGG